MSTYTKNKNIITITLDNTSGDYRLDINTGVFYGIKGSPIKVCPHKSSVYRLFPYYRSDNGNNLAHMLHLMFEYCTKTSQYADYVPALLAADKIDALGVANLCLNKAQYEYIGDNIKSLSTFLKDYEFSYGNFKEWCNFEKAKKALGSIADLLTAEIYSALIDRCNNLTIDEIGVCAYYLGRGKYWEYHRGDTRKLIEYIELCRVLEQAPQKVNNFMREYCETKKTYELRKTEFDNRKIALNYAKHNKAWEFEYGNHIIVIPTSAQDIITEGQLMHHCVGGYVNSVIENDTYICFVRHKDNPTTPYITCQVHTNGCIGQYFLAYDRYISSDEDKEFYKVFQNYLNKVWNN